MRVAGNATLNQPVALAVGSGGQRGNGTVVVEGDLHITGNVTYDSRQFTKSSELPSIGFLVRGDIIIDSNVSELAGAYVSLGRDQNCGRDSNGLLPAGCGYFKTGVSGVHLTVSGLVMGRHLSFQRTASGTAGSEEVLVDGRLSSNPPPGFADLVKGLPVWQQVAP